MSASEHESKVAVKPSPTLIIPPGSTVSLKIIDSTTWMKLPLSLILGPQVPGHEHLCCPAYSFLIEHYSGRKLLYDLGTRKDLHNCAPAVVKLVDKPDWEYKIQKDVAEILEENGVALDSIEGVVWSHWHFDHTGNMQTFPPSVNLIVGPGFKEGLLPGYPTNKDSHMLESDWEGRELVELDFNTDLKVGKFKAIDYFKDGSFYLLDAPGHAIGHTSALARVTKGSNKDEDTFVLMGGDLCHHGGLWKPNEYLPLPGHVSVPKPIRGTTICPGSWFQSVHRNSSTTAEFYKMAPNFPHDYDVAEQTIRHLQEFDAADNVLVIIAHDCAPQEPTSGFSFFPNGTLNDWKKEKLDEKIRWAFLGDFAHAVENGVKQATTLQAGLVLKSE